MCLSLISLYSLAFWAVVCVANWDISFDQTYLKPSQPLCSFFWSHSVYTSLFHAVLTMSVKVNLHYVLCFQKECFLSYPGWPPIHSFTKISERYGVPDHLGQRETHIFPVTFKSIASGTIPWWEKNSGTLETHELQNTLGHTHSVHSLSFHNAS